LGADLTLGRQKRTVAGSPWLACLIGGLCAACVWLAVADTPFLQDDYGFLYEAIAAEQSGAPFDILTLGTGTTTFWRPLSVGLHWRFLLDVLGGSPLAAHIVGAFLIGIAAACVGRLSLLYLASWDTKNPAPAAGFWASFLFGVHGAQFFPAAWACAVQETYAILFASLALAGFLRFCCRDSSKVLSGTLSVFALVFALLSKEGTVVLPLFAGMLLFVASDGRRRGFFLLAGWGGVVLVWLWVRSLIVVMPEEGTPYAVTLGTNLIRNAVLAILFMLGLPREALLLWLTDQSVPALLWGVCCVVFQATAAGILLWSCRGRLRHYNWHLLILPAISFVCLLPYLPLYSQAYPYYTLLALFPYAILVARVAADEPRQVWIAAGCAVSSTVLLIAGERSMPFPAPIARAEWAQEAFIEITNDDQLQRDVRQRGTLSVVAEDNSRFAALGYGGGLALAFGISKSQVHVQDTASTETQLWVTASGIKKR
jgi:hypothetical protein